MTKDKSQTRIHRFTIGIIIAITLMIIGGNIANINAVEFDEAFGTSFGETEDNGFEPEPLNAELSQPAKDIYTPVKKEADTVEPIDTSQIPETMTSVEKTPEPETPVEKAPDKTETVVAKDPVVEPAKKKEPTPEPKPEPKPEPVKPSFEPTAHSGDFMSEIELNMRSGPSVDFPSVGVLKPYTKAVASNKATISGGSSEWYEITVNGVTGWSSSSYLKTYKADAKPKPAPAASSSSGYKAMRIYFNGTSVGYKNGGRSNGQSIIDSSSYASTWGGVATFSGTDGQNTQFIGHSPGNFTGIQNASSFVVTDANGNAFRYNTTKVYRVNSKAVDSSGTNHWDRIVGTGGGERITIQTCVIGANDNWIIEASLVE